MKVSQLARGANVTADTVRHYVRIGLLEPLRDPENGYRLFSRHHLVCLRFIRRARQLGFRLDEIRSILSMAGEGRSACPEVRDLIAKRIVETRKTVEELQQLQERMESAARNWAKEPDCPPTGDYICHLIENWNEDLAED